MTKDLLRPCPICDSDQGELLHTQSFELPSEHPLVNGYNVVCCEHCGFSFADIEAKQADYDRYYESLSKYADPNSTGAGTSPWDQERLDSLAADIARFDGDLSHRILDIGCASGGLLQALKRTGFRELCGIDPSLACVKNSQTNGIPAFQGTLFQYPPGIGRFDGIVLSHVLEHVRDLRPAIDALSPYLNPAGWLYIEVPDATRYRDFVFSPFQDFNTEHINHFSPASLENLLRVSSFQKVEAGSKTILSAPKMPYPAIFAFAKPVADAQSIRLDGELKPALTDYIEISANLRDRMHARIQELVGGGSTPVAVWGTGQLTLKLLAETALKDANITTFIDGNPANQGRQIRGVPVRSAQEFHDPSATILVGSTINAEAILSDIKRLGLTNRVVRLD